MTLPELKKIVKEFEGSEIIFLLSVLDEEDINKLIKAKLILSKEGSKEITDYYIPVEEKKWLKAIEAKKP